ncbi:BQ2448_898 [Microbotryum intermedium]|uniref:BQ2448_898 protein n=1 Tax=Microbotryum intermedium TaxID=269621 RepID=A0A238F6K1_9BASI|nr:BQ2448_898 [Microbotryum intermedium]
MVQLGGDNSHSRLGRWLGRQPELIVAPSSRWLLVSVLKATLALTLTFALIFSRPFANSNPHAGSALNSMVLVVVAAYPGKTVGGFVQNFIWSCLGLFGGVVVYVILATLCECNPTPKASYAPVAQGFVFALWVYLVALVRALGSKYISFFLYGVLFAFNGIYSPIELGVQTGRLAFESSWLLAYFQAYGYGLVICLAVNLLVYPTQSSAELNTLLIASLQHISSLAHLTCKAYSKEIDADEEQVRSVLVQTIRSDYLALASRLEETAYEVRLHSAFRFVDWKDMIAKVQGLQQALITSSSAMDLIDELDPEGINVKRHLLARSESAATFKAFRRGIDLAIASIVDQLLGSEQKQQQNKYSNEDVHGQEMRERWHMHSRANQEPTLPPPATQPRAGAVDPVAFSGAPLSRKKTVKQLMTIGDKLRREVQRSEIRQQEASRESSATNLQTTNGSPTPEDQAQAAADMRHTLSNRTTVFDPERQQASGCEEKAYDAGSEVGFLREGWERFAQVQADALISLIKDGSLGIEDVLRIEEGMPGLQTMYADRLPKAWTSSLVAETSLRRIRHAAPMSSFADSSRVGDDAGSPEEVAISAALTKSYSILFGFGQLTDELCSLHALVTSNRKKRIRPYILYTLRQKLMAPWQRPTGMTLPEALATLKGEHYESPMVTLTQRLVTFERWLRGDRSLYAFKVAIGASLYTLFILTPSLQTSLFIKYGMTSSLITVIVAISPTLGQTTLTWALQLAGTGIGALYGLIVLEIFHNVGGHVYNPYGLTSAIAIWAAFSSFIFYRRPQYYSASLLMMVGSGNVVILEYLYNENPAAMATLKQPYEAPPLRFAHLIGSMGISIGISAILQLFFLRSPARRQLRKEIASITSSLARYNTLLQTLINVVAPADDAPMPSPQALDQIAGELVQQEIAIQSALLKLPTTFGYAKVEPTFGLPFKADVLLKIINSHQIILDRLREARTAVGTRGFNETVHKDFASALFPYRLHSQRLARVLFHLAATSLMCKTPLARDVPSSRPTWASFENDALVLSRRLSQLPRGEAELKRPGFLRYWFYLVSLGSVSSELENLEQYLGELFDDPHMVSCGVL